MAERGPSGMGQALLLPHILYLHLPGMAAVNKPEEPCDHLLHPPHAAGPEGQEISLGHLARSRLAQDFRLPRPGRRAAIQGQPGHPRPVLPQGPPEPICFPLLHVLVTSGQVHPT